MSYKDKISELAKNQDNQNLLLGHDIKQAIIQLWVPQQFSQFSLLQPIIYQHQQNLQMNQVRIINSSLLSLLVSDQNDQIQKITSKNKRKMSPEQTLKSWIKKGLTQYINLIVRSKTTQINFEYMDNIQSNKSKPFKDKQNSSFRGKKIQSYDRSSKNSKFSFRRLKTEENDSNQQQLEWVKPQFKEFINLSNTTANVLDRQNFRRNFKLHKYRKAKYEDIWKKHLIPMIN